MTTHEQFAADFLPYLLGELSPAEQAELERHLGSCGECRAELERSRTDLAMLSLSSADAAAPPAARARLMAAVAREPRMLARRQLGAGAGGRRAGGVRTDPTEGAARAAAGTGRHERAAGRDRCQVCEGAGAAGRADVAGCDARDAGSGGRQAAAHRARHVHAA